MKKTIAICFASLLVFAGCAEKENEETVHTHEAGAVWEWNGTQHWHVCACGEKMDEEAHEVEETNCKICGVEIWDLGDGSVLAISSTEYDDLHKMITYDADGNVVSETVNEYVYDENGNKLSGKYYEDGVLQSEETYVLTEAGENYVEESKGYYEDRSWFVNEYDKEGNVLRAYSCDISGDITSETLYEYGYRADGECYKTKMTCLEAYGSTITEYNENGDMIRWETYDASGELESYETYEYGYDEDGEKLWMKQYAKDVLVYEVVSYGVFTDAFETTRYPKDVVEYHEDGSKTVYEYDQNGDVISQQ